MASRRNRSFCTTRRNSPDSPARGFTCGGSKDFGEVLRLILHDFEFDQRTDRMRADELARKFLALDKSALALSQVRSAGRILVEDKYALEFSADLWTYAVEHKDRELESVSRAIYLQAKPLNLLYSSDPIDRQRKHDAPEVLGRWADVAPLFEAPESICVQIKNLRFGAPDGFWQEPEDAIKAVLLYRAISRSMVGELLFVSAFHFLQCSRSFECLNSIVLRC